MTKFNNIVKNVMFAALACIVLACLGILVKYFILKEWIHEKLQIRLGFISAALAFFSGALAIVAFGVYNVEVKYEGFSPHAGFYLTLTTGILSWISSVLFLSGSLCIGARMYPDMTS
ncbi:uncharacterized protein LOC132725240 [Ruditapes philippinarum]|uniref:uncharacterized protein LOC132725240 n=1 Tax=Ruditapes philippinarum TaxID=129788 RepID=UPI00295BC228|nr:uncharacterized protein LOC132725240 [Ruditapes philippinarum]